MKKSIILFLALIPINLWSTYHEEIYYTDIEEFKLPFNEYAFNPGEKLTYRAHYGWLTAGEAKFEVGWGTKSYKGNNCFEVSGYGKTASTFEWFYTVRDTFVSLIDKKELTPVKYKRMVHEGTYNFRDEVEFNHPQKKVKSSKGEFSIPENTHDLLSALYHTRCLNISSMPTGKTFKITTWLDNEHYDLGWKIVSRETIKTDLGTFKTIKIKPQIIKGRVFKDTEGMSVWITDDKNYVPLRIESPILVGSVKGDIKEMKFLKYPLTSKIKD